MQWRRGRSDDSFRTDAATLKIDRCHVFDRAIGGYLAGDARRRAVAHILVAIGLIKLTSTSQSFPWYDWTKPTSVESPWWRMYLIKVAVDCGIIDVAVGRTLPRRSSKDQQSEAKKHCRFWRCGQLQ